MARFLPPRFRTSHHTKVWVALAALIVPACGSTSTESVTGPTAPKCSVSLAGPGASIGASGGAGAVTVSTQPECEWTAAAESAWITELTPAQGQGSGQVQFQVGPNPNGTARESAVAINGQRALVRQDASRCDLAVATNDTQFPASGGAGTITIAGPGGCPWTASSSASWLSVSPASGSGSANVGFTVALNTGAERTGTITAGGTAIDITQAGIASPTPLPSCTVSSINPTSQAISAAAAIGIGVTVSAAPGCTWTATSNNVAWLTIASGASGSGNGIVMLNAAANTGSARVGTATIGGRTLTVNQAGTSAPSCTYSINPTSRSASAAAATGLTVAVSTSSGCAWTASSNNTAWLTITAGASGTGGGNVTYNMAANTGSARVGTLTIAGQTFTVNQAAPCTYSINPTSITVGDREVTGLGVSVSAPSGCAWTATSNANFVDITGGSSGSGNGIVIYKVTNFSGSTRTGTMTIAGQTFTVTQVACTATLNPQTQAVGALGGSFTVSVTTQIGCPWQAVESLTWVTITSGSSGAGSGTVGYTVVQNPAGARSGNIFIGGQALTVNQAAVIP